MRQLLLGPLVVAAFLAPLAPRAACPTLPVTDCIYVDDDCVSAGTGTAADPFCTIQAAYDLALLIGGPQTILVLPGSYNECVFVPAPGAPVRLVADAWLEAGQPAPSASDTTAFESVAQLTRISGSDVCDGTFGGLRAAVLDIAGDPASIEGFEITGGGASGIDAHGGVSVLNNLVHTNEAPIGGGVRLRTDVCSFGDVEANVSRNVVRDNLADDAFFEIGSGDGGGMHIAADGGESENCPSSGVDPLCCDESVGWDSICGAEAEALCSCCATASCDCCAATGTTGCNNPACVAIICGLKIGGKSEVLVSDNIVRGNRAVNGVQSSEDDAFVGGGGIDLSTNTLTNPATGSLPAESTSASILAQGNVVSDNQVQVGDLIQGTGAGLEVLVTGAGQDTIEIANNTIGPDNLGVAAEGADPLNILTFGGGISTFAQLVTSGFFDLSIHDNEISQNEAVVGGGADFLVNAEAVDIGQRMRVSLEHNEIANNVAVQSGGLQVEYNSTQSLDEDDAAEFPGAVLIAEELTFEVRSNTLRENQSALAGAGALLQVTALSELPDSQSCAPQPAVAELELSGNLIAENTAEDAVLVGLPGGPGCSDPNCEAIVCDIDVDPFCCDVNWDDICTGEAVELGCDCEISNCCGAGLVIGAGILALPEAHGEARARIRIDNSTIVANGILSSGFVGGVEMFGATGADCLGSPGQVEVTIDRSIVADNDGFGAGGPDPGAAAFEATVVRSFVHGNESGAFDPALFPTSPPGNFSADPQLDPVSHVPDVCSPAYTVPGFCSANASVPCLSDTDCATAGGACLAKSAGHLAGPDVNGDGAVDGVDVMRFAVAFGADEGGARYSPVADLNRDGHTNGDDLAFIAPFFGEECSAP